MNFDLSEDEEMLKALVERFANDCYDIERRRTYLAEENGFSPRNWDILGELGLISAAFPDEAGGLGLDANSLATVFEALGRGLVVEPLIENAVLAGRLFAASAPPPLQAEWMPFLLTGERRIALAHAEQKARAGRLWVETRAEADGGGIVLTGEKAYVPAGGGADCYIVSARAAGDPGDPQGVALYFIPADAAGLTVQRWRMADGSAAASLLLNGVWVEADRCLSGGVAEIAKAQELANIARSAEALGIMERIFAETLDYLRTREQFGGKLASFQAIQHRMVTQYAAIEQSRALLNLALVSAGSDGFGSAVKGARAFITATSVTLGHEMIQFHGGMGVTDELTIGQAHKRLLALSHWPDDPEAALDAFAGLAA